MYTKTEKWTEKQMSISEFMETIRKICDEGKGHYRAVLEHTKMIRSTLQCGRVQQDTCPYTHFDPEEGKPCLISDLLERAESAQHETFEGWKGGEYTMSPETPLWADDAGESDGMAITGLKKEGDRYIITTVKIEDLFALDLWR